MFDDLRAAENQIVVVRNPFDRTQRDVRLVPADEHRTVGALVGEYIPAGVEVDVSINGHFLSEQSWSSYTLRPGEQLVVIPRVEGGGGKGLLGAVLMIALSVVSGGLGLAAAGMMAGGSATMLGMSVATWGTIIGAGISMVGSMVIGALTAPTPAAAAQLPGASAIGYDTSPTYSWTPVSTQIPGAPIARAYGRIKLYGNIIAGYIENTGNSGAEQIAHMLLELGLGPYESLSDFKINDQPIGLYAGVTVTQRLGLLNQAIIPSFNDTRAASVFTAAKVVQGAPVVRSTVGNEFSALEIVLTAPNGLYYSNSAGGLDAHTVEIQIEMSVNGGAYSTISSTVVTTTESSGGYWTSGTWGPTGNADNFIVWREATHGSGTRDAHQEGEVENGQTWRWIDVPIPISASHTDSVKLSASSTAAIRQTYRVNNRTPGDSVDIRITNLSTDYSDNSRYGDAVYLTAINEIILDDFAYPRSVLVGIDALATNQLSGAMKFSCIAKAAKVLTYSAGSWSFAWSQSPAWICYDILTQPVMNDNGTVNRYDGLDPSRIDLQTFVEWDTFCSALVPDGKGGTEPRCLFDGVFDTVSNMWDAALTVAATARATLIVRGTTIAAVHDDVRSVPTQLFTVANSSQFSETFLPIEGRASVIEVEFSNLELDYGRDKTSIINEAVAAASGVATPASKAYIGITRASQAWRETNTMLARNEFLQRIGTISVDIDSLVATVGDRVDVQADVPQWGEGGRAVSGTTNTVVLDHSIVLEAGTTYQMTVRLSAGSDAVQTRTVTTAAGTVSAVTLSGGFDVPVSPTDIWAIGAYGKVTKPFLVTDITRDSNQRAKLSLIEYNASIYGIDGGVPATETPNVSASTGFGKIIDVTVTEQLATAKDGTSSIVLTLHFGFSDRSQVRATHVIAKPVGSYAWGYTGQQVRVIGDSAQFVGVEDAATYNFTLLSENYLGQTQPLSAGTRLSYTIIGRTGAVEAPGIIGAPPAPTTLTAVGKMFAVQLAWTVDVGVRRDIRYTEIWASLTNDRATAWRITVVPYPETSYTHVGLSPGQHWFYWSRISDSSNNFSTYFPANATTGVEGSPSTDPTDLLAALFGALGMPQLALELAEPIAGMPGALADQATAILSQSVDIFGNATAIVDERVQRTTDTTALAVRVDSTLARLDTGDFAGVREESSATAAGLGAVEAKWSVKVQTMADGHRALAGIEVLAGPDNESAVAILADKFLIYKPDGTGAPVPVLAIGTVNGVSTLGFDGSMIVDGTVFARSLEVTDLSSITANIGTITAGRAQNTGNTNFLNLDATGTGSFLKVGSAIDIRADGSATFDGVVISRPLVLASGIYSVPAGPLHGDGSYPISTAWSALWTADILTGIIDEGWSTESALFDARANTRYSGAEFYWWSGGSPAGATVQIYYETDTYFEEDWGDAAWSQSEWHVRLTCHARALSGSIDALHVPEVNWTLFKVT